MKRRGVSGTSLRRVPDCVLHQPSWKPPADLDVSPPKGLDPKLGGARMFARLTVHRVWRDVRRTWLDEHAPDVSYRLLATECRRRFPVVDHPTCPDTEVPA